MESANRHYKYHNEKLPVLKPFDIYSYAIVSISIKRKRVTTYSNINCIFWLLFFIFDKYLILYLFFNNFLLLR